MSESGIHCGFAPNARPDVIWDIDTFVHCVDREGQFKLRDAPLRLKILAMFFLVGGVFLGCGVIVESKENPGGTSAYLLFTGSVVCIFACLFLLLTYGHIIKYVVIKKVSRRNGRLFDPTWKAFLVGIEDAATFDKFKLHCDDIGLMHAENGKLLFEMERHRASFPLNRLTIEWHEVGIGRSKKRIESGVRIASDDKLYPWSIVVSPLPQRRNLMLDAFPFLRREIFWLRMNRQINISMMTDEEREQATNEGLL